MVLPPPGQETVKKEGGREVIKIHCKLLFRGEEDFSFSSFSSHLGRKVSGRHANIRVQSRPRCQKLCGIWCPLRSDSDLWPPFKAASLVGGLDPLEAASRPCGVSAHNAT